MKNKFPQIVTTAIVSLYLIFLAGAFVRMTGSGMGCPDWPKCFGLVIPPTSIDQIEWDSGKTFSEGQMIIFEEQLSRKPDEFPWAQDFIDAMHQGFWTDKEFILS